MLELTYFGAATVCVSSPETRVLIDPFFTGNDLCPSHLDEAMEEIGDLDVICVTHLAPDHLGDCLEIASEYGTPVVTEPGVEHYLRRNGVPDDQITTISWGMRAHVGDLEVRALEAHHHSSKVFDGDLLSGTPLSFLIDGGDESVYHMGDTSLFGDLKTFGELYRPDVTLVGVGQADVADEDDVVRRTLSELTTEEAALAAKWLRSEHVIPMHYRERREREAFLEAIRGMEDTPAAVPLDPGSSFRIG